MISRRDLLVATVALPVAGAAWAQSLQYTITPVSIGDGLWIVRGADEPIARSNGGAIANITILATPKGTVLFDCGPSLRYGTALKALAERLTGMPIIRVFLTHLHPDHSYGDGAFDKSLVAATPELNSDLTSEGRVYSDGMYRILGDWMRGTELVLPGHIISSDVEDFGDRRIRILPLNGHSAADVAYFDETTSTLIAGDLVFHDRAPSTPNADLSRWQATLDTLKSLGHRSVVPGHGPFDPTASTAIDQTKDWLAWLQTAIETAVASGLDPVEAGNIEIPARFADLKATRYELQRSISHLFAITEARMLPRVDNR
ncbi:MBL fold metallo-hydrolase (plasmid) [Sphingobium sp. SCG-1]|uniref:quinoprotein relay system zinc metallohydrolase 1 n=1 Tax=Sphingobium sp. SCG-1 TaxID=2072936 RepID=UPI000CD69E49|nr:quinoprotein relay system zinc metallohydrolase 1 [Sphingobium sp. SCG-1]AUW60604.1 MBL fold metallo-hydrolase [Sphingobium sp. SCG-1]